MLNDNRLVLGLQIAEVIFYYICLAVSILGFFSNVS